jgi:hypothetical protein
MAGTCFAGRRVELLAGPQQPGAGESGVVVGFVGRDRSTRRDDPAERSRALESDAEVPADQTGQHGVDQRLDLSWSGWVGYPGDRGKDRGVITARLVEVRHLFGIGADPGAEHVQPPQRARETLGRAFRPQLGDGLEPVLVGQVDQALVAMGSAVARPQAVDQGVGRRVGGLEAAGGVSGVAGALEGRQRGWAEQGRASGSLGHVAHCLWWAYVILRRSGSTLACGARMRQNPISVTLRSDADGWASSPWGRRGSRTPANWRLTVTTRGVVYVHSAPAALCPHVEWALTGALGVPVTLEWTPQRAARGAYRAELSWQGAAGTAAKAASALRGWVHLRFEVTEEPSSASEGARFSGTPELGIFHAVTGLHGDVMIPEDRLRATVERARREGLDLADEVDRLLGKPWDDELETFRWAGEGAPVRWLHEVV